MEERIIKDINNLLTQLFAKIHEAGYTWNPDEKKLEKIVIDEDKAEMDYCFTKMMNGEKVSPAWSEEDKKMYRMCVDAVEYYHTPEDESVVRDWLKSLKERCAWKPSDEQMEVLKDLIEDNNQRHFYPTLKLLYDDLEKLKEE